MLDRTKLLSCVTRHEYSLPSFLEVLPSHIESKHLRILKILQLLSVTHTVRNTWSKLKEMAFLTKMSLISDQEAVGSFDTGVKCHATEMATGILLPGLATCCVETREEGAGSIIPILTS